MDDQVRPVIGKKPAVSACAAFLEIGELQLELIQ